MLASFNGSCVQPLDGDCARDSGVDAMVYDTLGTLACVPRVADVSA